MLKGINGHLKDKLRAQEGKEEEMQRLRLDLAGFLGRFQYLLPVAHGSFQPDGEDVEMGEEEDGSNEVEEEPSTWVKPADEFLPIRDFLETHDKKNTLKWKSPSVLNLLRTRLVRFNKKK